MGAKAATRDVSLSFDLSRNGHAPRRHSSVDRTRCTGRGKPWTACSAGGHSWAAPSRSPAPPWWAAKRKRRRPPRRDGGCSPTAKDPLPAGTTPCRHTTGKSNSCSSAAATRRLPLLATPGCTISPTNVGKRSTPRVPRPDSVTRSPSTKKRACSTSSAGKPASSSSTTPGASTSTSSGGSKSIPATARCRRRATASRRCSTATVT